MTIKLIAAGTSALTLLLASCSSTSTDPDAGHQMTASNEVKAYPKDTCIVTGNKLGSMGDPIAIVHEGQEVKFCCKPCIAKFKANPDKFLATL
jgi:hypothetical protein